MSSSFDQLALFGSNKAQEKLLDRIQDGHEKVWERFVLIKPMPEGTGRDRYLKGVDEALGRLRGLCAELKATGFRGCLYKETPKYPCLCCPKQPWAREECLAWEIEL